MPIQLVGGFRITSKEPIDDRLVVTGSNGRFTFDSVRVHDGLTTFTTSSKQYHILVDSSSYTTDAGWRQIFIDQSSGSFNLTGSLFITGGNLSAVLNEGNYSNVVVYNSSDHKFYYTSSTSIGGSGFPFSGEAVITGSLTVSGSNGVTVTGGPITLTNSSITSVSSSINFTTGSINITNGSITISTGSFVGNLTGTASFADRIKITGADSNAAFPLVFTLNDNQLYSDNVNSITYNPGNNRLVQSQGTIEVVSGSILVETGSISASNGGFLGNLTGTASWAQNVVSASYANNAQNILPTLFEISELGITGSGIVINSATPPTNYNALRIGSTELVEIGPLFIINIGGSTGINYTGSAGSITSLAQNNFSFFEDNIDLNFRSNDTNFTVYKSQSANNDATTAFDVNRRTGLLYVSGGASISGSATIQNNVTLGGTLTAGTGSFNTVNAEVLRVTYVSSSVVYSSGSNTFGSSSANTQTLIGSVVVTGSAFTWNGDTVITTADTASMTVLSASYASSSTSASYASSSTSASYASSSTSASYASSSTSASYASSSTSASYASSSTSASYASSSTSASYASSSTSASYASSSTSASYASSSTSASYASSSTSASYASSSTSASYASSSTSASYASSSTSASYASSSTSASYASSSTSASYASSSTSASYASSSTSASYASSSTSASYASSSTSASYASSSTSASYASSSTSASYASSSTSASYASSSTSASYASSSTSASYASSSTSASYASSSTSASYASSSTSASYASSSTSASYASDSTNALTASYVNTLNQDVTINGQLTTGTASLANLTVTNNAVINGDFFVYGSSSFINVNNLAIEDKFILLNSGSIGAIPNEGGIIVQTTSSEGTAYGTALFYDQEANRWLVAKSSSVAFNNASITVGATTDYIVTVSASNGAPTGTPVNFGTGDNNYSVGQMYIQTDGDRDIYIYA